MFKSTVSTSMPLASAHFFDSPLSACCANSDETSNKVRTKRMGALSNQLITKDSWCNRIIKGRPF